MKTKVEVEGYEIEIEFQNGVISVKAEKDDEIVEEFTIEVEEGQDQAQSHTDDNEVQGFDKFSEEEDFEGQGQDDSEGQGQDDSDKDDEDDEMPRSESPALESFQAFINKRK